MSNQVTEHVSDTGAASSPEGKRLELTRLVFYFSLIIVTIINITLELR